MFFQRKRRCDCEKNEEQRIKMSKSRRRLAVAGTILCGDDFEVREGCVVVEGGKIKEVCESGESGEGRAEREGEVKGEVEGEVEGEVVAKGIVIPAFVNAHTHIGDSVAKEPDFLPLEALVGPGGLKHKILAKTSYETLVAAMKETVEEIFATGTQLFADFREGGLAGVKALKDALAGGRLRVKIFGRPAGEGKESGEGKEREEDLNRLLEAVDGVGVSSVADCPLGELELLAEAARERGKMFALHAGERNAADIKGALELEPDFLVHLTKAEPQDFRRMQDRGVAAVVCVRSNLVTGAGLPPLPQMLEAGLTVGLGTDNVMLNSPNLFSEMEFVSKIFRLDAREVLKMSTLGSAKVLGEEKFVGSIEAGKRANLVVVRDDTPNMRGVRVRDAVKGVVRRATRNDIAAVIYEGEVVSKI